jgi:hypothetical protein
MLILGLLPACKQQTGAQSSAPTLLSPVSEPADIVIVTRGDVVQLKIFEGTQTAYSEPLFFKAVDAPLLNVYVSPGDNVSEGDLLAELDVSGLEFQINALKDQLDYLTQTWAAIPAATDFDKKSRQIERERFNLKIGALEAKRGGYAIYAPFSGTVTHVESLLPGFVPTPRATFIWISDVSRLSVKCSDPLYTTSAAVGIVTADWGEGELPLNADLTVPSDKRVVLRVYGQTAKNALTVLPNAVHEDVSEVGGVTTRSYFVYVDNSGAKVRRDVVVGLRAETTIEIISGLDEGELVYAD